MYWLHHLQVAPFKVKVDRMLEVDHPVVCLTMAPLALSAWLCAYVCILDKTAYCPCFGLNGLFYQFIFSFIVSVI